MKVVLLVSRAGVDFTQSIGEEIEVSEAEAKRLIEANQAKPVAARVEPEKRRGRQAKKG